jgi:hypothetical protein
MNEEAGEMLKVAEIREEGTKRTGRPEHRGSEASFVKLSRENKIKDDGIGEECSTHGRRDKHTGLQ